MEWPDSGQSVHWDNFYHLRKTRKLNLVGKVDRVGFGVAGVIGGIQLRLWKRFR